jgi:hypothetical protein
MVEKLTPSFSSRHIDDNYKFAKPYHRLLADRRFRRKSRRRCDFFSMMKSKSSLVAGGERPHIGNCGRCCGVASEA